MAAQRGKASVAAYLIEATGKQLSERVTDFEAAVSDPRRDYEEKARELYTLLLPPAAKQLVGRKRLIVCPDGPLWGLPFQALKRCPEIAAALPRTKATNRILVRRLCISAALPFTR